MKKTLVTFRLDPALVDALKAYAEKDQRTMTTVVDRALRAFIGDVKSPAGIDLDGMTLGGKHE